MEVQPAQDMQLSLEMALIKNLSEDFPLKVTSKQDKWLVKVAFEKVMWPEKAAIEKYKWL